MNTDDIIRMAREAGLVKPSHPFNPWGAGQEALERFAALVAAAEREACLQCYSPDDSATDWADKIRARGQHGRS
jgi:hypothetical protein